MNCEKEPTEIAKNPEISQEVLAKIEAMLFDTIDVNFTKDNEYGDYYVVERYIALSKKTLEESKVQSVRECSLALVQLL